jgi:hypothetical protein
MIFHFGLAFNANPEAATVGHHPDFLRASGTVPLAILEKLIPRQ